MPLPRGMFHDLQDGEVFHLSEEGTLSRLRKMDVVDDDRQALDFRSLCGWGLPESTEVSPEDYLHTIVFNVMKIEKIIPTILSGVVDFDLELFQVAGDAGFNTPLCEAICWMQTHLDTEGEVQLPDKSHPAWQHLYDWDELHFRVVLK